MLQIYCDEPYIAGRAEHHKNQDFKAEFLRLLHAHEIEHEEKNRCLIESFIRVVRLVPLSLRDSLKIGSRFLLHGLRIGFASAAPVATIRDPAGVE
jgi:hypothetical protein